MDEETLPETTAAVATLDPETAPCDCGGACATCAPTTAASPTVSVVVDDRRTFSDVLNAALARAAGDPTAEPETAAVEVECPECVEAAVATIAAAVEAVEAGAETVVVEPETAAVAEPLADGATETAEVGSPIDSRNPGRFRAVLVVEEEPTDDGRIISRGATIWRDPPLPMMLMTRTQDGHDGAEVAAVIEKITRQGAQIIAEGRFDVSDAGIEAARMVRDGVLTGVSLDGGNVDWEVEIIVVDGDEVARMRINAITLLGASIVPFPAFANTPIEYMTASGLVQTGVTGRIEWLEADAEPDAAPAVGLALTASGPRVYPANYFSDPHLSGPTVLRVMPADEDGNHRVFGHLATWGVCHIGISGVCTTAPRSRHEYAYFRTGTVYTDDGAVAVGALTMGTDHPDSHLAAAATKAHYDNTGMAAAYVSAGEDEFGIWVSGVLAPGISEERATQFAASSLSGDWRAVGGSLELVAALAVNVPGFPIIGMRDGDQLALVAAGYGPATADRQSLQRRVAETTAEQTARLNEFESRLNEAFDLISRLDRLVAPTVRAQIQTRLASGATK